MNIEIEIECKDFMDSISVTDTPFKNSDVGNRWSVRLVVEDGYEGRIADTYLDADALDKLIPELTRLREEIRARHAAEAEAEWQIAQLIEDQGIKYFNKGNGKWLCEGGCTHSTDWFSTSLDIKIITK